MSEQPEALRLAAELEKDRWHISGVTAQQSADELRKLHDEIERLRAEVERLREGRDALMAEIEMLRERVGNILDPNDYGKGI